MRRGQSADPVIESGDGTFQLQRRHRPHLNTSTIPLQLTCTVIIINGAGECG